MKKTLAIILSVIMLFGVMPFASFAADEPVYDRAKIAANDEAYIADMTAEQIASLILDWVDREIAKYTNEMKAAATEAVIAGFEGFELAAFGDVIAEQIPDIASLDDVITYKDYLKDLGGTFAELDATALITRAEAGSAIGFIDGIFQFMADNSEKFGRVFRWDEQVFDYGKVGEYILSLDETNADNKKIIDFYNDYLIGNDIQSKFINWIAKQMNYTPAEGETFDDTLNNGILGWFVNLCETNGILSAEGIAELKTYDLRTNDIYTLVKNFVALVQSDNQVKIDTYYNYLMDTVVRSLLKTTLGQVASAGEAAELPASFAETYKDLVLLEEISGGKAYYKDGDNYYEVTIANGVAAAKALTWEAGIEINFEAPTATIYTGKNCDETVQVYRPTSKENLKINLYATAKNQALIANMVEIEFAGDTVAEEYAVLMTEENAKALADSFGLTVAQGEEIISELKLTFAEIEAFAEEEAAKAAKTAAEGILTGMGMDPGLITVESVDVVIAYRGYATEDEFICEVVLENATAILGGSLASFAQGVADSAVKSAISSMIDADPVVTVVVDGLSGNLNIDDAKALLDFIDTDFVVDADLLDFAGNYDVYNGVVGQVNHILYSLADMLVSDSGMKELDLVDGNNDNFTANLQKVCDTANGMMAAAEEVINNEEYQKMLAEIGLDISAVLGEFNLDLLYDIDFSSVENLWVSVIGFGLDMIDNGTNEIFAEIHAVLEGLTNLDAMAVAMADYLLDKFIPEINTNFADLGLALTVPAKTDAAAVSDGTGKDIIMTKFVDILYETAVWGVDFINGTVNDIIETAETEVGMELPTVAFKLGVEKGANWEATLAALVSRVYELADGIIIACDNEYKDTFDKIAAVANAILPLGSLASNCASENFAFDVNKVMGFIFDDGLEGDLDGFLRLFETRVKTEDVAADVSVTEALINASEHIVDAIFPDTVKAELYVNLSDYSTVTFTETTVQEYFTSAENDAVIASNNMDSINARKSDLVPAVLNIAREAGILPFFAKCDKDHSTENLTLISDKIDSTCTAVGYEAKYVCDECGYSIGGEEIAKKAHVWGEWGQSKAPSCVEKGESRRDCANCDEFETNPIAEIAHSYGAWSETVAVTCTTDGIETRTCNCGKTETKVISATGNHVDNDGDALCDTCSKNLSPEEEVDNSFFGKIKAFFLRIIEWFKNLFK